MQYVIQPILMMTHCIVTIVATVCITICMRGLMYTDIIV